jgi:hypothetical protein
VMLLCRVWLTTFVHARDGNHRKVSMSIWTMHVLTIPVSRLIVFRPRKLGWWRNELTVQTSLRVTSSSFCLKLKRILFLFNQTRTFSVPSISDIRSKAIFIQCHEHHHNSQISRTNSFKNPSSYSNHWTLMRNCGNHISFGDITWSLRASFFPLEQ